MPDKVVTLETVSGMLEAEILRGMLDSFGIQAILSGESAATAYGLGVGPMAQVDIRVREIQLEKARKVLTDYRSGKLSSPD
jgi:hypothetical protein